MHEVDVAVPRDEVGVLVVLADAGAAVVVDGAVAGDGDVRVRQPRRRRAAGEREREDDDGGAHQ